MRVSKSILVVLCAASFGAVSLPMPASAAVGIYLNVAPPASRYEAVPAPRRGYVWSPGYWNARGKRHVWKAGHWERQRSGYHYSQPTWTQQGNRWQLDRGHWNRGDADGDGVSNGADRSPNNPDRH